MLAAPGNTLAAAGEPVVGGRRRGAIVRVAVAAKQPG
jgi:hypothetical protein